MRFDDGDIEELTPSEVKTHRAPYALRNLSTPVPVHMPTPKSAPTHRYPTRSAKSIALGASKYGRYDNRGQFAFAAEQLEQLHAHSAFLGTTVQQTNGYAFNGGKLYNQQLKKIAARHKLVRHPNAKIARCWRTSGANEFGRLFQGYKDIEGLDVLEWIYKADVPRGKKVTYPRYVVDYRPEKDEPYHTHITCGGNLLDYFVGNVTTHTASMETIKCHWNSVLSTRNAQYCTADILKMYLCSMLPDSEYICFQAHLVPQEIIDYYNLTDKIHNGYIYARVKKAWYGLKQAGKIAHDDLVAHLREHGYYQTNTIGFFRHKTRDISFTLVVDNFGIKYTNKQDVMHLFEALKTKYLIKVKFDAPQFVGIDLK